MELTSFNHFMVPLTFYLKAPITHPNTHVLEVLKKNRNFVYIAWPVNSSTSHQLPLLSYHFNLVSLMAFSSQPFKNIPRCWIPFYLFPLLFYLKYSFFHVCDHVLTSLLYLIPLQSDLLLIIPLKLLR